MCYHAGSDPGKVGENFMQILRASEDYLETMLMMQQQHGYIRSIDVAEHLGVTKPSVTYATKRLRENGYITTAPWSWTAGRGRAPPSPSRCP